MSEHEALIKRLEEAEGADREIDGHIARLFGGSVRFTTSIGTRYQVYWAGDDAPADLDDLPELPNYTASIDAALALVERLGFSPTEAAEILRKATHYAFIKGGQLGWTFWTALPIAILIALMKAVEARDEG